LNQLFFILKEQLSKYNVNIKDVKIQYSDNRFGDIPHSLACIKKSKDLLGYNPKYSLRKGLIDSLDWYWNNQDKFM
jgi:UDP-N-acetylglucosamine 4-epimerase